MSTFTLAAIEAFIFDMDGVIFDSEQIYYDAFFKAAEKNQVQADHHFVSQFAGKTSQACQLILQNYLNNDFDKMQRFWQDWGRARLDILSTHGLSFKTGFLSLLAAIKAANYPVALVTSANRLDMEENFARNNYNPHETFEHIITIEDVKHPKPHPEPYQMMIKHLGYAPNACIIIEDSPSGVSAAVAAGANTIMINSQVTPDDAIRGQLLLQSDSHENILAFLQQHGL